jgi:hypothetical protein
MTPFPAGLRPACFLCFTVMAALFGRAEASSDSIFSVSVSKPFFNPTEHQEVDVLFATRQAGSAQVLIVDRDGYLVRRLVSARQLEPGTHAISWDGKDDAGLVVADEAYSLRIGLDTAGSSDDYFPAALPSRATMNASAALILLLLLTGSSDGPKIICEAPKAVAGSQLELTCHNKANRDLAIYKHSLPWFNPFTLEISAKTLSSPPTPLRILKTISDPIPR